MYYIGSQVDVLSTTITSTTGTVITYSKSKRGRQIGTKKKVVGKKRKKLGWGKHKKHFFRFVKDNTDS